jgi:hypothetical protein
MSKFTGNVELELDVKPYRRSTSKCHQTLSHYSRKAYHSTSHKTSFLSDPQFPDAMLKLYKGMRIAFFEEIYEKYSQLEFTHLTDRSLGMAGIESRFAKLFGRAQYGILDHPKERSYLRRSLLWRRADETKAMIKIDYPPNRRVPSWSWMAVMGSISFMDVPFGAVDWTPDLESPFKDREGPCGAPGALGGDARDFSKQDHDLLFFDRDTDVLSYGQTRCLILGTQDIANNHLVKHYGLLVATTGKDNDIYERVGVVILERDQAWMSEGQFQRIRVL